LHADFITNSTLLAKNGDSLDLDTILDDAGCVAGHRCRGTFHTGPGANSAVPANDGIQHASVVLDLGVLQYNGLLDAHTSTDGRTRTDRHVRAELGGGVDLRGRVDEDWGDNVCRGGCELLGTALCCLLEVESIGRDGGPGSLDLAPEVLGLVHKELFAVRHVTQNVLLEADDLVLAVLVVVVVDHEGALEVIGRRVRNQTRRAIGTALDGGANRREDSLGAEQINAAVDQIGDVAFGLLDVVKHTAGVGVGDDAAKVGGGILANPCSQNNSLGILILRQFEHLVEWEAAADIRVQHEQSLRAPLEDRIAEVVEAAGGAQGLVFAEVFDRKIGKLGGGIFNEVTEDRFVVVSDEGDLTDRGDFGDGGQAVPDDGVASNIEEGLMETSDG